MHDTQRCMIVLIDPYMFTFVNCFKLWVKLATHVKQTKVLFAKTSYIENQWNFNYYEIHNFRNYWRYSMLLLPNELKLQNTGCDNINVNNGDLNKAFQINALNVELGFCNVSLIEDLYSTLGWLKISSTNDITTESKKNNNDKELNKNYVRFNPNLL